MLTPAKINRQQHADAPEDAYDAMRVADSAFPTSNDQDFGQRFFRNHFDASYDSDAEPADVERTEALQGLLVGQQLILVRHSFNEHEGPLTKTYADVHD